MAHLQGPGDAAGPRPPRRMTYGAQQNQQQLARNELLSGAEAPANPQEVCLDDMNNKMLMQHGLNTHKETTATAKRALQIVEQTKEIQASTQAALRDQGDQMRRIEADMDKIGEDLSYSERILRFMRMCCCFSFFCACCTEPARNDRDKNWRGPGSQTQAVSYPSGPAPGSKPSSKRDRKQQQHLQHLQQQAAYPGVSTNGLGELGLQEEADQIDAETQQQNQYLDEISNGLDQLKFGAQRMNEELRFQEAHADRIARDTEALESKLNAVNREGFKRI